MPAVYIPEEQDYRHWGGHNQILEMTDLVLPRARTRSRRRLPRPPKFTTTQKFMLAWMVIATFFSITMYAQSAAPSMLFMAAGAVTAIRAVVLDALHPPSGGLTSHALSIGVLVFALALGVCGQ